MTAFNLDDGTEHQIEDFVDGYSKFTLDDGSEYLAEDFIDGYLINPLLLEERPIPKSPFIMCHIGHKFSVHCLIRGHISCLDVFDNLDDALNYAKNKQKIQ
ncbi:hypothetical protein [Methylobacter sp.]|jgi:hypothetical protein|uniref:hypothetical protein n=1 Tax=Methylobacter sp. TaxID=2051955 RepID=UPI003DA4E1FB